MTTILSKPNDAFSWSQEVQAWLSYTIKFVYFQVRCPLRDFQINTVNPCVVVYHDRTFLLTRRRLHSLRPTITTPRINWHVNGRTKEFPLYIIDPSILLSNKLYLYWRYYKCGNRVPTSYFFPTFLWWSSLLSATFQLWCDNNGKQLGNVSALFPDHPWPHRQLCPSPLLPKWLCCQNALKILQISPNLLCTLLLFHSYSGTSGRWEWHYFRHNLSELFEERTVFFL